MIKIENVDVDIDIEELAEDVYNSIRYKYKGGLARLCSFMIMFMFIIATCIGFWNTSNLDEASIVVHTCVIGFEGCLAVGLYSIFSPLFVDVSISDLRGLRMLLDARHELDAKHYVMLALDTDVQEVPVDDEKFISILLRGDKILSMYIDEKDALIIMYEDPDAAGCIDTLCRDVVIPDKDSIVHPVTLTVTADGYAIKYAPKFGSPKVTFVNSNDTVYTVEEVVED